MHERDQNKKSKELKPEENRTERVCGVAVSSVLTRNKGGSTLLSSIYVEYEYFLLYNCWFFFSDSTISLTCLSLFFNFMKIKDESEPKCISLRL